MAGQGGTGPAVTLGSNELVTILSLLQRDLPAQLQLAHRNQEHPLAVQIRQEVVEGARKLGVESDNLQLDGLDEDAVDLVALLFDVLLDGPQFDTDVRRKIGRLGHQGGRRFRQRAYRKGRQGRDPGHWPVQESPCVQGSGH